MSFTQYRRFTPVSLPNRTWPDQQITKAPTWCSVDLRDGNQALMDPMSVEQKLKMFDMLVGMGFKEIEVGFPSASQTDFDFVRAIIEGKRIPTDVTIQVLTQARENLIKRTYQALDGVNKAIVHVYNSTSVTQRKKVFKLDVAGIEDIAIKGARWVQEYANRYPTTQWQFQYSPESFTQTEPEVAARICNAVINVWQQQPLPIIINLPATVEVSSPNHFADQIEWMHRHLDKREQVVLSVHTHNDRGCGVAAAELAVMAGADRVEGTVLGNGERTGNMDIITMAMNLYSQGIDPALDMTNMDHIVSVVKECTALPVHPRHPYAGELVFTAFSGSHQDAIKKSLAVKDDHWDVAYLPINPEDIGRNYDEVIRVNSQSGKGGIAFVLEKDHGLKIPRAMQIEFSRIIQAQAEQTGSVINPNQIWQQFKRHYLENKQPVALQKYQLNSQKNKADVLDIVLTSNGNNISMQQISTGPLSALVSCLSRHMQCEIEVIDFFEHSLGDTKDAQAAAFIQLKINQQSYFGCGLDQDILSASFNAAIVACNRFYQQNQNKEIA